MSEWISKKLNNDDINGGNEFETNSNVWTLEEVNAFICGIFYAEDNADEAKAIASGAGDVSEIAKSLATTAKEQAESAVATATAAKTNADTAVTKANDAVSKAEQAVGTASSANEKAISAVETAGSANQKAEKALVKVENISVETIENDGEIFAEVETLPDGNLKIVLYNAKGDTGAKGDKGDGAIPIYDTLGINTDGAINQKVVSERFTGVDAVLENTLLVTDQINISGGEA